MQYKIKDLFINVIPNANAGQAATNPNSPTGRAPTQGPNNPSAGQPGPGGTCSPQAPNQDQAVIVQLGCDWRSCGCSCTYGCSDSCGCTCSNCTCTGGTICGNTLFEEIDSMQLPELQALKNQLREAMEAVSEAEKRKTS